MTGPQTPEQIAKTFALLYLGGSFDGTFERVLAAAIRSAVNERLEMAAQRLDETAKDGRILHMWDRPGGPPGNGYGPFTGIIAASIAREFKIPEPQP